MDYDGAEFYMQRTLARIAEPSEKLDIVRGARCSTSESVSAAVPAAQQV